MKALAGATRAAFLGFFASHIVATLVIDSQAVLPSALIPRPARNLLEFYVENFNDPLMAYAKDLTWFWSLVCGELLIQFPFFFVAIHQILKVPEGVRYPDWFRTACIVYGSHTATGMVPILSSIAFERVVTTESQRWTLMAFYVPYLLFPLWLLWLACGPDGTAASDGSERDKKAS